MLSPLSIPEGMGSRFGVPGSGFKVQGSRFKVQGSRFNGYYNESHN
jgi:hypothetical protein